ncbi:hypothetical protein TTHERM_01355280, partial (macronuclear) [Tetrahymena thermophila SB210]
QIWKIINMSAETLDNKANIQVLINDLSGLSQFIDKIEQQIQQIKLDNEQYKKSENAIVKHVQMLNQKIEKIARSLNSHNLKDQKIKSQETQFCTNIKKGSIFEKKQKSLFQEETEKSINKQSPQNIDHPFQIIQCSNLKLQKSVTFQFSIQEKNIFDDSRQKEENDDENQMIKYFNYNSSMHSINSLKCKVEQTKSILKKSKTLDKFDHEISPVEDQKFFNTNMADTDYCELRNHEFIKNLIQSEQINSKNKENYFYSESVTKLSKSGKQELKIICMTQNFFYVFPQKINNDNVKKFLMKDINDIIIDVNEKQKCSIVIKNEFQLNLIISHRNEFLDYIFRVFKNYLNTLQPKILYKQAQQPQLNPQNKNSKPQIVTKCSIFKDKNQYYKIFILKDHTNLINNNKKSNGILLINNDQNFIQFSKDSFSIEVNLQVKYLKKDVEARILQFQSLDSPYEIFNIQLQSEYDFPLLAKHLEYFSKQQLTIK